MTISAKIVCDSIYDGHRISTLELRYPRFIHAEVMTHRVFSRNASSSRAIPVSRLIQDVLDDTAMPIHWGKNQKGMQARQEHDAPVDGVDRQTAWLQARDNAIDMARAFERAGYHKQIVNRLIEPFSHINTVLTGTDFEDFFKQRRHPDAQPEIKQLADLMFEQLEISVPTERDHHLPYTTWEDPNEIVLIDPPGAVLSSLQAISAARCARVSYKTHDGRWSEPDEDIALARSLISAPHPSPFEHQAFAAPGRHANFTGWSSLRHALNL